MNTFGKQFGYAVLRVAIGMMFFIYGLEKFLGGRANFANGEVASFAKTPLSPGVVHAFSMALPFFEVIFGGLVALGVFTVPALCLAGLLLLALNFGLLWLGASGAIGSNTVYVIAVSLLLYSVEENRFALETLWRKRA